MVSIFTTADLYIFIVAILARACPITRSFQHGSTYRRDGHQGL